MPLGFQLVDKFHICCKRNTMETSITTCILLCFLCQNCYGWFEDVQASILSMIGSNEFGKYHETQEETASAVDGEDLLELVNDPKSSEMAETVFKDSVKQRVSNGEATKRYSMHVRMPHVTIPKDDTYLCTKAHMPTVNSSLYITGYVPHATQNVAHHMLLFACGSPGDMDAPVWDCGSMSSTAGTSGLPTGSICTAHENLVWAWAKDAPAFNLPPGVGFRVGRGTPFHYLVLQVHFKSKKAANAKGTEHIEVTALATSTPQPKVAGIYIASTSYESIKPKTTSNWDIVCQYKGNVVMHPFAFRTHTHKLGVQVMGFKVKDDKWSLIGHKNPQLPEAFYPVKNKKLMIKKGDWVAARCVMHNFRNRTTWTGAKHTDEMCNFYFMYWTPRTPSTEFLLTRDCGNGFQWVHWRNYFNTVPSTIGL